jgi:hypothetical protein
MSKFLAIALVLSAGATAPASSPPARQVSSGNPVFPLIGVWRGHSECAVANSPCHDETNVYRVSEVAGSSDQVHIVGAKIVDGKEITMGSSDWRYDAAQHDLQTELPAGIFRLHVDGGSMEGVLMLPDHTVYRRIHLRKDN